VKTKRHVLILTDGAESTHKMAERIGAVFKEAQVRILSASDFSGTDILPADVCFLGCEEPSPPSFAYLEQLLKHINLVGRPCGIFSPKSREAIRYLSGMVHDAEMRLSPEPFLDAEPPDLPSWVTKVINQSGE
jgi:hypothetical protein